MVTLRLILPKHAGQFRRVVWELLLATHRGHRPGGGRPSKGTIGLSDQDDQPQCDHHAAFVPSMLSSLSGGAGSVARWTSLRRVICSGEALPAGLSAVLRLVWCFLHNLYGPTETAVDVTYWDCRGGEKMPSRADWATDLEHAGLCFGWRLAAGSGGVLGELYIGGRGAGARLSGAAGLTAERFVAEPVSGEPGAGCTGPAIWRAGAPTGCWSSSGPADQQVKIRGFRIEPGEIEAALTRHPSGAQAAVIAREDGPGSKRLVGLCGRGRRSEPRCRRRCVRISRRACRTTWFRRRSWFWTAAADAERQARPQGAAGARRHRRGAARAAHARRRRSCARCSPRCSALERVGIDDNFFALGGDSIISIQLVSRARQAGLIITPRAVFQHQTVEAWRRARSLRGTPVGSRPTSPSGHWRRRRSCAG